jgi:DNA-binding GntR family transcriptional regulator
LNNIRERSWYIRRWLFGIHHHEQDEYSAVAEHKAILSKMIDGDIEGAGFCMREHMKKSAERTLKTLPLEKET